ncbi:MAG TPA: hypothetical protein V6D05_11825 [Stenomitos sp.]
MAAHRWVAFTALSLALFALGGCGSTAPTLKTASVVQAQATSTRPAPPKLDAAQATESYAGSEARRIASDTLYRYEDLRRDWFNTSSDYQKDRIEQQMITVLVGGLQDVQHATYGSYTTDARRLYDVATRALERNDGLRRDWQYAYGDREKRQIVNDQLTVLTGALMDIRDRY